ncbi:MAG: CARDB domain-containing protein [Acidobacteriota bacterium]|nr:CARDB domain-containing protein [Acidobacteriota bacterium]
MTVRWSLIAWFFICVSLPATPQTLPDRLQNPKNHVAPASKSDPGPVVTTIPRLDDSDDAVLPGLVSFSVDFNEALDAASIKTMYPHTLADERTFVLLQGTSAGAAMYAALDVGGFMALPRNAEENRYLHAFFGEQDLWLGISDIEGTGNWVDHLGEPISFSNWNGPTPADPAKTVAYLDAETGYWVASADDMPRNAVLVVPHDTITAAEDPDGDKLLNASLVTLDPYPNDRLNAFDLRQPGADGLYDTADDLQYSLIAAYTPGETSVNLIIFGGPLQLGAHRLTVTASVLNTAQIALDGNGDGIPGDHFEHYFTVTIPDSGVAEAPGNHHAVLAQELTLVADSSLPDYHMTQQHGFGGFDPVQDVDWWTFSGTAGDRVSIFCVPVTGANSIEMYLFDPDGVLLGSSFGSGPNGGAVLDDSMAPGDFALPKTGVYTVQVSGDELVGPYRIHMVRTGSSTFMEGDAYYNNSFAEGSKPIAMTDDFASAAGTMMSADSGDEDIYMDEDIFDLNYDGYIGQTLAVTAHTPEGSTLKPFVEVFTLCVGGGKNCSGGGGGGGGGGGKTGAYPNQFENECRPFEICLADADPADERVVFTVPSNANGIFIRVKSAFTWYDDVRYIITPQRMNRDDAISYATENGGHLASIHSQDANDVLTRAMGQDLQLGLVGFDSEGSSSWGWLDGSPVDYLPPGFPAEPTGNSYGYIGDNRMWQTTGSGAGNRWGLIGKSDANAFPGYRGPGPRGQYLVTVHPDEGPFADLSVENLTAFDQLVGSDAKTVSWTVQNRGEASTTGHDGEPIGTWVDRVYLVNDEGSEILLAEVPYNHGALTPDAFYEAEIDVTAPEMIDESFFIRVITDYKDDVKETFFGLTNQRTAETLTEVVSPAWADLSPLSLAPSGVVQVDAAVTLNWTVANTTDAYGDTVKTAWVDRLVLSVDDILDHDDIELTLKTHTEDEPLPRGLSYDESFVWTPDETMEGTRYLFLITDFTGEVHERNLEGNNTLGPVSVEVLPAPMADLALTSVVAPNQSLPEQSFEVSYTVVNNSDHPFNGTARTTVSLSADNSIGEDRLLAEFDDVYALAAGESVTFTPLVTLPADVIEGNVYLVVAVDSDNQIEEDNETDNAAVSQSAMLIPGTLTVTMSASAIDENADPPVLTGYISRSGSILSPLTVDLVSSDTGELTVPAQVTIPAGQSGVGFEAQVVPDNIVDGPEIVTITASNALFLDGQDFVTVLNVDTPQLTVVSDITALDEGDLYSFRVQHNGDPAEPITLFLESDPFGLFVLPDEPPVMPGNTPEFLVELPTVDNLAIRQDVTAFLTVSSPGFGNATLQVIIRDNDAPVLSASPSLTEVSEAGGADSLTLHLARDQATAVPLKLGLVSSLPGSLTVPEQVEIPEGETDLVVNTALMDNGDVDGDRAVTITIYVLDTLSGNPLYEAGQVNVTVIDDEQPSLILTLNRDVVAEGVTGAVEATVTRNADTSGSLNVTLTGSDGGVEIDTPVSFDIPDGETSTTVSLDSLQDGVTDGDTTVTLTAQAAGHASGSVNLVVTDTDLPDLTGGEMVFEANTETGAVVDLTYTVANQGLAEAGSGFFEQVYLSRDPLLSGNDQLVAFNLADNALPANGSYQRDVQLTMPNRTGEFWILLVLDQPNLVNEIVESNNRAVSQIPLQIDAAYTAVVSTDLELAANNTPVPLYGNAVRTDLTPAANKEIKIDVIVREARRTLTAYTDENGDFTATFYPLRYEGGYYTVSARHPAAPVEAAQDAFDLQGVRPTPKTRRHRVKEDVVSRSGSFSLKNLADQPLENLEVTLVKAAGNAQITWDLASPTIPADGTVSLSYTLTNFNTDFVADRAEFKITQAALGLEERVYVEVEVVPLAAKLKVTSSQMNCPVVRKGQKAVTIEVENIGGAPTGDVRTFLPPIPWLQLASPEVFSLDVDESATVTLVLTPPEEVELGEYTGNIAFDGPNVPGKSIGFNFRVVGSAKGDLNVSVVDEAFYFDPLGPKIEGARVTVRDAFTLQDVAHATTGPEGEVTFPDLVEGYYKVEVHADRHETFRRTVLVEAEQTTDVIAFLSYQAVRFVWSVVEDVIRETYEIQVESTFETVVPKPVLTVTPAFIDLKSLAFDGQIKQVDMKIKNRGLIAAQNVTLEFGDHPDIEVIALAGELGEVAAGAELVVPVIFRRISGGESASTDGAINAKTGAGKVSVGPCDFSAGLSWGFTCGPNEVVNGIPIPIVNASLDCGPNFIPQPPPDRPDQEPRRYRPRPRTTPCTGCNTDIGKGVDWSYNGVADNLGAPPSCACEQFSVFSRDFSNFFKPPAKIIETALKAKSGGMFDIEVEPSATATLKKCCDELGNPGVEIRGDGKLTISASPNTNFKVEVDNSFDIGDGASIEVKGTFFAGLDITPYISAGGFVSSGCNTEWDFGLNASIGGNIQAGVQATLTGTITAADGTVGEPFEVGITGLIKGGASATIEWSKNNDLKLCAKSDGLYPEISVNWGTGGTNLFPPDENGNKFYFLDPAQTDGCNAKTSALSQLLAEAMQLELERIYIRFKEAQTVDASRLELLQQLYLQEVLQSSNLPVDMEENLDENISVDDLLADVFHDAETRRQAEAVATDHDHDDHVNEDQYLVSGKADGDDVCARVKMNLSQELALTRTIFRANLDMFNDDPDLAVSNIDLAVEITTPSGDPANDLFEIREPELINITAADGTGTLPADAQGSASWVIIPREEAAPEQPLEYLVGGVMLYSQGGATYVTPMEPRLITVNPTAQLHVRYFHERDVFSDDPFTTEIEPSLPYSLGVIVENRGAGIAGDLTITSGQPNIVDNDKGLAVAFEIIGSEIDGQSASPSLKAEFGDLGPDETAVGRWLMTSTLHGLFLDYSATFTHTHELGEDLSQLKSVEIHETNRVVQAAGVFQDGLPDFLVNDIDDQNDRPDTLYLSNGDIEPVSVVEDAAFVDSDPGDLMIELQLTNPPLGWTYLRVPDPGQPGWVLSEVRRDDGTPIPLGVNAWTTDRTFIGQGTRPLYENIIHILDHDVADRYIFIFVQPGADVDPPVTQVDALPPSSSENFTVSWSGVDESLPITYDIFVSVDGGPFEAWITGTESTGALYAGQPGSSYSFYSVGTDAEGNREADPATADAATTVDQVNQPPFLNDPGTYVLDEGGLVELTLSATDPDGDPVDLRFTLDNAPNGLILDSAGGFISWPTAETHGGSNYSVTVTVTDAGDPPLSDTITFIIQVNEQNQAPVLTPVPGQSGISDSPLSFQVIALDEDVPLQTLTYSLDAPTPAGLTIDAVSGVVSWPEPVAGDHLVTVRVVDNGAPALEDVAVVFISIEQANRPPTASNPVPAQTANVATPFNLNVDTVFTDADGDLLTLTATQTGGAALPSWLSFQGNAFSGTPETTGMLDITLTATDPDGASASTQFTLTIGEPLGGSVAFTQSSVTAREGDSLNLDVARTGTTIGAVTATWRANPGTAPTDAYQLTEPFTLTWADGDGANKTIPINLPDGSLTAPVGFQLELISIDNGAVLGAQTTIDITITPRYNLSLTAVPIEGGTLTGDGGYDPDASATIQATAAVGYRFDRWEGEDITDVNAAQTTVLMTGDKTVTAHFIKTWNLTVSADPTEGGTVSGGGTFDDSVSTSVTAEASAGYRFSHWSGEGIADTQASSTTVTVNADKTITAHFIKQWNLTITAVPVEGGTVTGAGTYDDGQTVNISAEPDPDYNFVNWSGATVADPNASQATLVIGSNVSLTANFELRNQAPVVVTPLTDVTIETRESSSWNVTAGFGDPDGDMLSFDVSFADDSPLPLWLVFDGTSLHATPEHHHVGVYDIRVDATDPGGLSVSDSFRLTVIYGPFGDISVLVFKDLNANTIQDLPDVGLADWNVFLDTNHNGVWDTGEPTATTNANGAVSFTDLPVGRYTILPEQQTGYLQTYQPADMFGTQQNLTAGLSDHELTVADLDSDGFVDIASADKVGNQVNVHLNNGDGTFAEPVSYPADFNAREITSGEVDDGDGIDLITANRAAGTVSILSNFGDGTFRPAAHYAAGVNPFSPVLHDMDGDGFPELVVANSDGKVQRFSNQGHMLAPLTELFTGAAVSSIAVGNLLDDPAGDLVVAHQLAKRLRIYKDGNPDFSGFLDLALPEQVFHVLIVDLDGDGMARDLLAAGETGVMVLRHHGDGYDAPILYNTNTAIGSMTYADFDMDGRGDIMARLTNTNRLKWLQGKAHGSFELLKNIDTGDTLIGVHAADADRDGDQDIVIATASGPAWLESERTVSVTLTPGDLKAFSFGYRENYFKITPTNDLADINPGDGIVDAGGGVQSLRAAVMEANALPGPDVIDLGSGNFDLELPPFYGSPDENDGDLDILDDLTIIGNNGSITARHSARLIDVSRGAAFSLIGVDLFDGDAQTDGGAVLNEGETHIADADIRNSNAPGTGGAIHNTQDLTLDRVSIIGATATRDGGGLYTTGRADLTNVTLGENTTAEDGGGIYNSGRLNGANNTIVYNQASQGGGLYNNGVARFRFSALAANGALTGTDVYGKFHSQGHNLVGDGNKVEELLSTDLTGETGKPIDPELYTEADNGGGIHTYLPQFISPLIDAGEDQGLPSVDARGFPRPVDGDADGSILFDIGAVERGPAGNGVLWPNGGEILNSGETVTIRWLLPDAGDQVTILMSPDNGATWKLLGIRVKNDGSFGWTISGPATDQALIRIVIPRGADLDVSDAVFTITGSGLSTGN